MNFSTMQLLCPDIIPLPLSDILDIPENLFTNLYVCKVNILDLDTLLKPIKM